MSDTNGKILKIISENLGIGVEKVSLDSKFKEDLGADSLDITEIIMNIEDEFGIKIAEEEIQKIGTVSQAIKIINNCLK